MRPEKLHAHIFRPEMVIPGAYKGQNENSKSVEIGKAVKMQ